MVFAAYIRDLIKYGKCCFTLEQAEKALGKTRKAVLSSIEHLLARGELASPSKGFYVIVPPQYHKLGCIPAEHFIPYLMDYWGLRYYVGLLSAARYHGASHQATQIFQVMIDARRPPLVCGKVNICFITNRHLALTPVQKVETPQSVLIVSTPEGTAMDLVSYPRQSGGLNHIATVLSELQEAMSPAELLALANSQTGLAWKQRLGYMLEMGGRHELTEGLKKHLSKIKRVNYISLIPGLKSELSPRNSIWKIIENARTESDI